MSRRKHGGGKRRWALGDDEPVRTCIACRARLPREAGLRFARAPDGAVGFDVRATLPGRGAWTCARPACVAQAVERRAFERAFGAPVLASAAVLLAEVLRVLTAEVAAGLGLLRRSGALVAGRDEVTRALASPVRALVLAADLSARTVREVEEAAQRAGAAVVRGPAQADIGIAIGRKPTGVLAVTDGPRARALLDDLARVHLLAEGREGA